MDTSWIKPLQRFFILAAYCKVVVDWQKHQRPIWTAERSITTHSADALDARQDNGNLSIGGCIKRRIKQSLLVGGAVATVGLAGLGSLGVASAANNSTDPQSSIIEKLASKFNLNKEEVQKVFDEERTAREAAREARIKEKLDQLVTDKKITQEQADKLVAKAKELKEAREAKREDFKNKSEAERKQAVEAERTALKQWLSNNGIAEEYARYLHGGRHGRGLGGPTGTDVFGHPDGQRSESTEAAN